MSKNANITVNLLQPKLTLPPTTAAGGSTVPAPAFVQVEANVMAHWGGADDRVPDVAALGKDGFVNWVCTMPPLSKTTLVLEWEVTAATGVGINRL